MFWNVCRTLKGQQAGAEILLDIPSACENWCYHIWSHYEKLFSEFHKLTTTTTTTIQQQLTVSRHKQSLLHNKFGRKLLYTQFERCN